MTSLHKHLKRQQRLLPELVGKWYTKAPIYRQTEDAYDDCNCAVACADLPEMNVATEDSDEAWCYCRGKDEGEMILCDSDACQIGWFHTQCLKLSIILKGKWFCLSYRMTVKRDAKRHHHEQLLLYRTILYISHALPVMSIIISFIVGLCNYACNEVNIIYTYTYMHARFKTA